MEERRRQQYQEHEMRMMEMLGWMIQQSNHYGYTGQPCTATQCNYEDSTYMHVTVILNVGGCNHRLLH